MSEPQYKCSNCKWETRPTLHSMCGPDNETVLISQCMPCQLHCAELELELITTKVQDLRQRVNEEQRSKTALGRAEIAFEKAWAELERARREENTHEKQTN